MRDAHGNSAWYDASELYASKAAAQDDENERQLVAFNKRTMQQLTPPQDCNRWLGDVLKIGSRDFDEGVGDVRATKLGGRNSQDFKSWLKDVRAMKLTPEGSRNDAVSNSVAQFIQPTMEDITAKMSQLHMGSTSTATRRKASQRSASAA